MNLKDVFSKRFASDIGTTTFNLSLNKEFYKTPHYRMQKVLEMLEDKPTAGAGVLQMVLFLLHNLRFESEDQETQEFANEWLEKRAKSSEELTNFAYLWLACGTSYLEPTFSSNGKFDNFFHVPDPSMVHLNILRKSDDEYWLLQVPQNVRQYRGTTPKQYPVAYTQGQSLYYTYIWAIPMPKDALYQAIHGWSRNGFYGAGVLSSAVDDRDIEVEILKNWQMQAKYHALGKKIISVQGENGESVDPTEIEAIKDDFQRLQEEDSLIINRKIDAFDFAFNSDSNMENNLEYLQKDMGAGTIPRYMTPFSQDSSFATAAEAKIPFEMRLAQLQSILLKELDNFITKLLRESFSFLSEDLTLIADAPIIENRIEKFNTYTQLYNMRAATFNELRLAAGATSVEGGDVWGEEPPLDNVSISKDTKITERQKRLKECLKRRKLKESVFLPTNVMNPFLTHTGIRIDERTKEEGIKEAAKRLLNNGKHL